MLNLRVMTVNDDILQTKVDPRRVIALYGDDDLHLNVGYPAIAAYKPILGNMWGYKEANTKGLYIMVDTDETLVGEIFDIVIDESRKVVTSKVKVDVKNNYDSSVVTFEEIKHKKKKRALY